jgi:hypothetical protein
MSERSSTGPNKKKEKKTQKITINKKHEKKSQQ